MEEAEEARRWEQQGRWQEYDEARKAHVRRVRAWDARAERERERLEVEAAREKAVERLRRKVEQAFHPQHAPEPRRGLGTDRTGDLPFELAAPGEGGDEHIRGWIGEVLRRGRLEGFDRDRFEKMLALPRSGWKRGRAGWYGYVVLMFAHTEKVLLECPIRDNAIYVLDSGERRLLKMNKQQLIASDEVRRIFHTGEWYRRVKEALDIE